MKQNNWTTKLHTEWSRKRAGDFDLTGKCDWKSDRKCSTWRMRRRFAAYPAEAFHMRFPVSVEVLKADPGGKGNPLDQSAIPLIAPSQLQPRLY